MMTGICAVALLPFKRRQTSNPSIPGIITSSRTMSHLPLAQSAKASVPFVAVKTSKYSALSRASISLRLDEIVDDQNPCGNAMGVPAFLHALNTSRPRQIIRVTIAH
jgi:hypothetical protein